MYFLADIFFLFLKIVQISFGIHSDLFFSIMSAFFPFFESLLMTVFENFESLLMTVFLVPICEWCTVALLVNRYFSNLQRERSWNGSDSAGQLALHQLAN